jgi:cytoskeletal protein RodZ
MIAEGKRNISVDLAGLDYIYSDTINALIVMNKRMLDVFGRLSLLAPQPPVMDILKKSGVPNILKVFVDEAEIIRLSADLSGQPGGIPAAAAVKAPVSEFDDLRAEIGTAFGDGLAAPPMGPSSAAQPPASAPRHVPGPSGQPHFQPPHPQPGLPRTPAAPMPPQHEAAAPARPPLSPKTPPPAPKPTAPQPPKAAAAPVARKEVDLDDFEATLDRKPAVKPPTAEKIMRTRAAPKKSSSVPLIIAIAAIVVLGGGFLAIKSIMGPNKEPAINPTPAPAATEAQKAPAATEQPATAPQQAPQQAAAPSPAPAETAASAPATTAEEQPAPAKKLAKARAKAKKREAAARKKAEAQEEEAAATAPATPQPKAAAPAKVGATTTFIASQPPNADVYIDGQLIGKSYTELKVTPGSHTIRLVKDGKEVSQQITFHAGKNPTTFISIK